MSRVVSVLLYYTSQDESPEKVKYKFYTNFLRCNQLYARCSKRDVLP